MSRNLLRVKFDTDSFIQFLQKLEVITCHVDQINLNSEYFQYVYYFFKLEA